MNTTEKVKTVLWGFKSGRDYMCFWEYRDLLSCKNKNKIYRAVK